MALEEDIHALELKVKQLKVDYEQYFAGARPREPIHTRADVHKQIAYYMSTPIKNTALRFKFNSVNSRYQAFRRQWDAILRQIEAGTYRRDVFRANLHDRERVQGDPTRTKAPAPRRDALFDAYLEAAKTCGQSVKNLTPKKLAAAVARQERQIRTKLGCEKVRFRVVVEKGRVVLKASAIR